MLIKKEKKGSITIYYVNKDMSDEKAISLKNKSVADFVRESIRV